MFHSYIIVSDVVSEMSPMQFQMVYFESWIDFTARHDFIYARARKFSFVVKAKERRWDKQAVTTTAEGDRL